MILSQMFHFAEWFATPKAPAVRRRSGQSHTIEGLEIRSLLTSFAWSNATSLTISFAPDGTEIAGNSSELYAELDQLGSPAEWQSTIVSAFQRWLNELEFSISVVADTGVSFGTNGATHGDSRFGDVRIGAVPLTSGILATAIPQNEFISGTWAGDMMLNSTVSLTSLDELYALSLHEAGHILGLEHSADPNSPMSDHGGTATLSPTAEDLVMLRSLHGRGNGIRASQELDDAENDSSEHAERIAAVNANGMFSRFESSGVIANSTDIDTFVFRASDVTSEDSLLTTVILRTESPFLIPRVTLRTAGGKNVETTVVANGNGLVILQSREIEADKDYIVSVQAAVSGSHWSQGRYELAVTFSESGPMIERLAKGTLDREKTRQSYDLYSAKSQLFNFQLATEASGSNSSTAMVVLSVYGESGLLVFRAVAKPGETATNNTVLLGAEKYKIVIELVAQRQSAVPEVEFRVHGTVISTDAGPMPNNPKGNPSIGPGGTLPYVYPNNVTSTRPFLVTRPTTNTTTGSTVPVTTPVVVPLTWEQMLLNYPWMMMGV